MATTDEEARRRVRRLVYDALDEFCRKVDVDQRLGSHRDRISGYLDEMGMQDFSEAWEVYQQEAGD